MRPGAVCLCCLELIGDFKTAGKGQGAEELPLMERQANPLVTDTNSLVCKCLLFVCSLCYCGWFWQLWEVGPSVTALHTDDTE